MHEIDIFKEARSNKRIAWFICLCLALFAEQALAAGMALGDVASSVTSSFTAVGKFFMGVSYIAGIFGVLGGIGKLKSHRDAPQQVPVSSGLGLLLIGAICLFLPTLISVAGFTLFGPSGGKMAGPSGITLGGPNLLQ